LKRLLFVALAALAAVGSFADTPRVVVTTGWVAAFVRTAGYTGPIRVLAPLELQHPPEYELKPSDITAVAQADFVVYAGYEVMVSRLRDAAGGGKAKVLQIATDHSLKTIQASVRAIAEALGTTAAAAENLRAVEAFYESWRKELAAAGLAGAPILAHAMQRPLLAELGFTIVGVFGPGPLEAAGIRDLSAAGTSLVADNVHGPVGQPLRETVKGIRYAALVNFPSAEVGLIDILATDRKLLAAAWVGPAR
jgi:zinc transport system substrate-binding protein